MLAAVLTVSGSLCAAAETPSITNGLVGYWKFDEGHALVVHDSAGTNHGTIYGAKWASGDFGTALLFDVSRAQIEIPADRSLDLTNELTLCAWLRSENFDTPIVNKLEYWAPGNYDFRTERSGALSLSHEAGTGQPWSHYESTNVLTVGRWNHVAASLKAGGDVCFYIDGNPAGTVRQTGRFGLINKEPLRVAAKPDPYSSFHGLLKELRIYNRVLSAEEVRTLATDKATAPPALPLDQVRAPTESTASNEVRTTIVSASAAARIDSHAAWPQWLGPERDNKSKETGLLRSWPAEGPAMAWWLEGLGEGYSTVSIANGHLLTTGMIDQQEILYCFDLSGQLKWRQPYGSAWKGRYPEARTTPTLDGDRAYVISGMGRVVCLNLQTGEQLWAVDAAQQFGTRFDFWGIAESPLVVGDLVICTPSGTNATMVALNKRTGQTVWTSKSVGEESNYCSPILVQLGTRRLILTMLKLSIIGVDADNGQILWRILLSDYQASPHGINPNSPVYHDGAFYTTTGYDCGGALHQISPTGDSVTRLWVDRVLDCHHGGVIFLGGYLYGSNFKNHYAGNWVCLDWRTGKVMYEQKWICKGALTFADGLLYCYEEKSGTVGLIRPTPEKFAVICSFRVPKGTGPHWAFPVVCGGRLYIRHGTALMAYDIKNRRG